MKCLFIQKNNIQKNSILVTDKDYHHVVRVLRLQANEIIELKDTDYAYTAVPKEVTKNSIRFSILSKRKLKIPKLNITLCLGILKTDAFNFVLEKTTELGVSKIIPYKAERSVVKINTNEEIKKNNKWQKICEEAAKQCGCDIIPSVEKIINNIDMLNKPSTNKLIAYENEKTSSLKGCLKNINPNEEIIILIGPEGGFTENEYQQAKSLGFASCLLNENTLKSETAVISIISNILFYF